MGATAWIVVTAGIGVAGAIVTSRYVSAKRKLRESAGQRGYPLGGEIRKLNQLLQEGTISPEEYELLKRRILAGQVY